MWHPFDAESVAKLSTKVDYIFVLFFPVVIPLENVMISAQSAKGRLLGASFIPFANIYAIAARARDDRATLSPENTEPAKIL